MRTTNKIITAETLGQFKRFSLGALGDGPDTPLKRRAILQREASSRTPPPPSDEQRRAMAEQQRQQQLQTSFDAGYREGMAAGRAAAIQEHEQAQRALGATLRQRVERLAGALEAELDAFQHGGADRLLDLAIEIARQTVRQTIAHDRETILPVVQEALAQLYDETLPATLTLNPADLPIVQTNLAALLARRRITLQADPGMALGGCQLVSAAAEVDATVPTRWRRALAALGRTPDAPASLAADD